MHLRNLRAILPVMIAVFLFLAACGSQPGQGDLREVTVQLRWYHQASAAGHYTAAEQGFYADQGLAVSFLPGGPEVDVIQQVLSGKAQFGVTNADTFIQAVGEGKPLVAVAVIFQRSPLGFMVLEDSPIRSPRDFVGKKIRAPLPIQQTLRTMMAKLGIGPDQYTILPNENDLQHFYDGSVEVWGVFVNNLPNQVRKAGYEVRLILPDDYGVHTPGDVIFTTREINDHDPDLVQRFVFATLDGWYQVFEHPEEAAALVGKYRPEFDAQHELQFLLTSLPLINPGGVRVGDFDAQVWEAMLADLVRYGQLPAGLKWQQMCDPQAVENYYRLKVMPGE